MIAPSMLADSAKTRDQKQALANRRVDEYFNKLILDLAPFVQLPTPVVSTLRQKYSYSINPAGVDRAVEAATKIRATTQPALPNGPSPSTAVPLGPGLSSTAPSGGR